MKRLILVISALIFIIIPVYAEPAQNDYSNVKGDFKTICLGDTKEVVKDKIKYLIEKKGLEKSSEAEILGEYANIYYEYDNNKLYKISFWFTNSFVGSDYFTELKKFHDNVKSMFVDLYGNPNIEKKYPETIENTDEIETSTVWKLDKKTIVLGIAYYGKSFFKNTYITAFYIIDNQMIEQTKEIQEKLKENSKKDF